MGKHMNDPKPLNPEPFTNGELKALLFAFDSIAWMPGKAPLHDDIRSARRKVEAEFKARGLTP